MTIMCAKLVVNKTYYNEALTEPLAVRQAGSGFVTENRKEIKIFC